MQPLAKLGRECLVLGAFPASGLPGLRRCLKTGNTSSQVCPSLSYLSLCWLKLYTDQASWQVVPCGWHQADLGVCPERSSFLSDYALTSTNSTIHHDVLYARHRHIPPKASITLLGSVWSPLRLNSFKAPQPALVFFPRKEEAEKDFTLRPPKGRRYSRRDVVSDLSLPP